MFICRYVVLEKALFYVPGMMVSNEERTKIRGLAAEDLKNFIKSRSTEMKKGKLLVSKNCRLCNNKLVRQGS